MSLENAHNAYQAGNHAEARRLAEALLAEDPQNEEAQRLLQDIAGSEGTSVAQSDTYEMLWDCEFCGTKKLLGLTHRFCPNCGAAQDPDLRYFPSDEEKVAVHDHVYYGADTICPSCNSTNSGRAEFCGQCGTPLSDAARASRRESQTRAAGETFQGGQARDLVKERFEAGLQAGTPAGKGSSNNTMKFIIAGAVAVVVLCIGIVMAFAFWNRETSVVVTGHSWEREIKIEEFSAVDEGDWCDSMPGDAYDVSRSRKQRDTERIPDGETCTTRRVDNGDGTFREVEECQTTYREEPVFDDYCDYTVNRWTYDHSEVTDGTGVRSNPVWPEVSFSCTGQQLGCEREGAREEHYYVHLRDAESGDEYECDFDQEKWRSVPVESRWTMEVGVIAGTPRCDSLKPG